MFEIFQQEFFNQEINEGVDMLIERPLKDLYDKKKVKTNKCLQDVKREG